MKSLHLKKKKSPASTKKDSSSYSYSRRNNNSNSNKEKNKSLLTNRLRYKKNVTLVISGGNRLQSLTENASSNPWFESLFLQQKYRKYMMTPAESQLLIALSARASGSSSTAGSKIENAGADIAALAGAVVKKKTTIMDLTSYADLVRSAHREVTQTLWNEEPPRKGEDEDEDDFAKLARYC